MIWGNGTVARFDLSAESFEQIGDFFDQVGKRVKALRRNQEYAAKPDEIVTAIKAVTNGLAVLPGQLLPALLSGAWHVGELLDDNDADRAWLTPRELEVLAAMADGVSNKAIARG